MGHVIAPSLESVLIMIKESFSSISYHYRVVYIKSPADTYTLDIMYYRVLA